MSALNFAYSQKYINIPRKDTVVSLLNSYLDLFFDIVQSATDNRSADNNNIGSVNLGLNASFSNYK